MTKKRIKALFLVFVFCIMLTGCFGSNNEKPPTDLPNPTENPPTIKGVHLHRKGDWDQLMAGETVSLQWNVEMNDGTILPLDGEHTVISLTEGVQVHDGLLHVGDGFITGDRIRIRVTYQGLEIDETIKIANFLSKTIDSEGIVTNPSSIDVVVNKQRSLPSDFEPDDLMTVTVPTALPNPEIRQLRRVASEALSDMFQAAEQEAGLILVARSGYRSYNTQVSLYNNYVTRWGQEEADKFSAKPGQSEHQTGLAMDITAASVNYELSDDFGETLEGSWVRENAHRFGFVIRYPKGKEEITGYQYEPWHLRYLGINLATIIVESGLTMEEYFQTFENGANHN